MFAAEHSSASITLPTAFWGDEEHDQPTRLVESALNQAIGQTLGESPGRLAFVACPDARIEERAGGGWRVSITFEVRPVGTDEGLGLLEEAGGAVYRQVPERRRER